MIQRIRPSEYLADIRTMTEGERKGYLKRVGEWLADSGRRLLQMTDRPMALSQNVVQLSVRWTADECRMFRDGTLLLTALVKVCDTWLPAQLYARSANRAVRHIAGCLMQSQDGTGVPHGVLNGTFEEVRRAADTVEYVYMEKEDEHGEKATGRRDSGNAAAPYNQEQKRATGAKSAQAGGTSTKIQTPPPAPFPTDGRLPVAFPLAGAGSAYGQKTTVAVPPRPDHISQYIHLLPEKTQERAKEYGSLMRQMEEAHANLALVADDPKASDKVREGWAKKVSGLDKQIGDLRKELDREWEKVVKTGRVVMDDLGMAHVVPADGGDTDADATDTVAGGKELSKEDKVKVKQLRSWLRDTRGPKEPGEKRDAYVAKWTEKYREMIALGGPDTVTDAVSKAAELYGIDTKTIEI